MRGIVFYELAGHYRPMTKFMESQQWQALTEHHKTLFTYGRRGTFTELLGEASFIVTSPRNPRGVAAVIVCVALGLPIPIILVGWGRYENGPLKKLVRLIEHIRGEAGLPANFQLYEPPPEEAVSEVH